VQDKGGIPTSVAGKKDGDDRNERIKRSRRSKLRSGEATSVCRARDNRESEFIFSFSFFVSYYLAKRTRSSG